MKTSLNKKEIIDLLPHREPMLLIEELINEGLILQGGLGDYPTFTHYDIRKTKARW